MRNTAGSPPPRRRGTLVASEVEGARVVDPIAEPQDQAWIQALEQIVRERFDGNQTLFAAHLGWDTSKTSRVLAGKTRLSLADVRDCRRLLFPPGDLLTVAALTFAAEATSSPTSHRYELLWARQRISDLEREAELLRRSIDRQRDLQGAGLSDIDRDVSAIVAHAVQDGCGVSVVEATTQVHPGVEVRESRRIQIVVPQARLDSLRERELPADAASYVDLTLRPSWPATALILAEREGRREFPLDPAERDRTVTVAVDVLAAPRWPGRHPLGPALVSSRRRKGVPELPFASVLVLGVTPEAWSATTAALLARSLDWGLDSSGVQSRVDNPYFSVPAQGGLTPEDRVNHRARLRSAACARWLRDGAPELFVLQHFGGDQLPTAVYPEPLRHPLLTADLGDPERLPFVVLLDEGPQAIDYHLLVRGRSSRSTGVVRSEVTGVLDDLRGAVRELEKLGRGLVVPISSPVPVPGRVPDDEQERAAMRAAMNERLPLDAPVDDPSADSRRRRLYHRSARAVHTIRDALRVHVEGAGAHRLPPVGQVADATVRGLLLAVLAQSDRVDQERVAARSVERAKRAARGGRAR